jgi:hypothetical protein
MLIDSHAAGALSPAVFLCEAAAAEDAGDGAKNLPLGKRTGIVGEENLAGTLRLRAMAPAAEETEMIGDGLAVRL